jgi:type II secretory pathway pseudopilin PulG
MKVKRSNPEKGYVLLALMLAFTLILVALSVEAPRIAQQIKRDKEEELVHRGKDYATAIKRFAHKNGGRYPVSIDQLENTNQVRFLRKRYKDPITGEDNWRLVHVGEAQAKIPTTNPGLPGSGNPGLAGGNTGLSGTNSLSGTGPATNQALVPGGTGGAQPQPTGATDTLGSITTTNIGNGQQLGGQIMGVASINKGKSIKEFNEKDHYEDWYFVYDPQLEQAGGTGVTVAAPRVGGSPGGTAGQAQGGPQQQPTPVVPAPAPTPQSPN